VTCVDMTAKIDKSGSCVQYHIGKQRGSSIDRGKVEGSLKGNKMS